MPTIYVADQLHEYNEQKHADILQLVPKYEYDQSQSDLKQAREEIEVLKAKLEKSVEKYQDLAELYHVMTNSKNAPQDAYNHRVVLEKELSAITIDSIKRGE